MNKAHEQLVDAQFGPRAKAYVESAVHARGPDLEALEVVVGGVRPARALDLGTGGGHVAYLMARHAGSVTASDLSREMLAAVAAAAKDRGLTNVEVAEASAERLTFDNEWFDFLGCRYSAHQLAEIWRPVCARHDGFSNAVPRLCSSTLLRRRPPRSTPTCRRSSCSATPPTFATTQPRNGSPRSTARASHCRLSDLGVFAWTSRHGLPGCKRRRITSALSARCKRPRPAKSVVISR